MKLGIALLGILIGAIEAPLWLILLMLIFIIGLLTETFLKTVLFIQQKQARVKRLNNVYERKRNRREWINAKPDLPMLEYKNYKW